MDNAHLIPLLERNCQALGSLSEDNIRAMLLQSFHGGATTPLILYDDPSIRHQLHFIFLHAGVELQERFKSALVRAIRECQPLGPDRSGSPREKLKALRDLAYLASDVKASGVVQLLRSHVEMLERRSHNPQARPVQDTIAVLIAVLGGFAPLAEVRDIFERFFFDTSFNARFAAQLLNGLCLCAPEKYPRYLPRFLELANKHQNDHFYALGAVIRELTRILRLHTIVKHLPELNGSTHSQFLTYLRQYAAVRITLERTAEGEIYVLHSEDQIVPYLPEDDEARRGAQIEMLEWMYAAGVADVQERYGDGSATTETIIEQFDHLLSNEV